MVEAPPVAGATTPPLLYSLSQDHDAQFLAVCRYADRGCLPTLLSLGRSSISWYVYYTTIGSLPKAAHDLLCSLNGNSLITLYWSSVTPGTMEYPVDPGDTTWASCMYFHAVFGFFQNARCIMVEDRSSPANARETAPPDLNECIEKSPGTPAAIALCFRSIVIWLADSGCEPRTGDRTLPNIPCGFF